ncbi:ribosomal_L14e domain-containing protein [Haematococcus lacustris]|uniref:Ribosomal_L14e domain-containing protein n=1 Tax=Haematococcus lacustris TaxID=44745 RepID=A0A699YH86_HAELA|nr:ribosomal_L14e domain-containing protein [Haematococcus lacustris]
MPFKRPMEIGRVAMINFGEDAGKLIVVSDILDQNRARRVENFKRLSLTDYKLELPRLAPKKVVIAKFAESDVIAKFGKSSWGQKLAKHASKVAMNDFDRFKAAVAKAKKARAVRKVFSQLQKAAKK